MAQVKEVRKTGDEAYIPDHRIEIELSPRWVRVKFGGETIADSKRVLLSRETGRLPVYYFPQDDVRMDLLEAARHNGSTTLWTVKVGDKVAENAAWSYNNPTSKRADLNGYIAFKWHEMDAWYEEEEEVFVHPRDPYKRVDVMPSSRHVKVIIGGEVVADTHQPSLLFETGLPTRYYIPKEDIRMDLLEPTETHTRCPYKGIADYWTVRVGDKVFKDIAWGYQDPIPECPKIKGLVCFFNEKVDAIYVDDELIPVPKTPWS